MRTTAVIYVNCDRCNFEKEVLLENETSFDKQVKEELEAREWKVTDEEDICYYCVEREKKNGNTSKTSEASTKDSSAN